MSLWPHSSPVSEYRKAGAPVEELDVKEGTYLSMAGGNLSLVNKAPHPNASKIFINWLLSREGQTIIQNYFHQQSSRNDLSLEGLDSLRIRKAGQKYFLGANSIEEWVDKEQDKNLDLARQIFGLLIK